MNVTFTFNSSFSADRQFNSCLKFVKKIYPNNSPNFFDMEDIFQWCREGNSLQVRVWLDETTHDMNAGYVLIRQKINQ